jgi:sugar (pentulose or hexulose) kinase
MKYLIGIDGGTQSTKVSIFDVEGNIISEEKSLLTPLYSPDADTAEHPNDDLWDSLKVTCKRVMDNFKGDKKDILAIGLGSIRCCRSYLDKDGMLCAPIINWMDKRLEKPYPGNIPNFQYIATTTAYLTVRLTGELKDTAANYEGLYGPFNKETWSWSDNEEDYKPYNITRDNVFDLVMPGEQLGCITKEAAEITGLLEGCPVIATANDKATEGLGAGIVDDTTCLVSLGTYIGGMINGHEFNNSAKHYWSNLSAIPHQYLYEGMPGIRRGMWSISWFKEILGIPWEDFAKNEDTSIEKILDKEAENVPPGCDGLITVPEFMAPVGMHYRKALMIGFDGRHKRAHIYRSLLEAIAMTIHMSMEDMFEEKGYTPERLIISGGGSNSDEFMRIFADVFGMPSYRNEVNNAAGIGAAICAAIGAKVYPSYEVAVEKMVKIKNHYEPNEENVKIYQDIEKNIYRGIKKYSDPINKEIFKLFK